jgi:hypothetical protein
VESAKRARDRSDNEELIVAVKTTESAFTEPHMNNPEQESAEPNLAKVRTDMLLPTCTKSIVDTAEPKRNSARTDTEELK